MCVCVCVCVCTSSQSLTSFQNLIGFNFSRPTRLPRLIESFAHKVFISNVHLLIFSDLKGLRILIERYMFVFFSSQCCLSIQIVLALPTLSGGKQQVTCSRISMFITDRQAETPGRTLKMASVFSPPWLWVRDMTYAPTFARATFVLELHYFDVHYTPVKRFPASCVDVTLSPWQPGSSVHQQSNWVRISGETLLLSFSFGTSIIFKRTKTSLHLWCLRNSATAEQVREKICILCILQTAEVFLSEVGKDCRIFIFLLWVMMNATLSANCKNAPTGN